MSEDRKEILLGMSMGKASNILRKKILLMLIEKLGLNFCFQCGNCIESEKELSIEHKVAWLNSENPAENFWNLDNIAFSHRSCNSKAGINPASLKTHCIRGHAFEGDNLLITIEGHRRCRTCRNAAKKVQNAKRDPEKRREYERKYYRNVDRDKKLARVKSYDEGQRSNYKLL